MDKQEWKEFAAYIKESFIEIGWWGLMLFLLSIIFSFDLLLAESGMQVIAGLIGAAGILIGARAFYERVQAWDRRP